MLFLSWLVVVTAMNSDSHSHLDLDLEHREAHARAMLQKLGKQNQDNAHKERLWRWALRGVVIQWINKKKC